MNTEAQANVLLVDDKPENLLAMESVLADLGQNLISATSAREALRYLLIEDVALILLDVQMPGLTGFELAELIRERERTQHTPIIFISATSVNEQYIFKGYSLGAVDYLTKPFDPEILKSKVRFFTRLFLQHRQIRKQSDMLEQANRRLDQLNAELEERVHRRTEQLENANRELENEIAIRRISESRLATEHAITRVLAAAKDLEAAVPSILRVFCEHMHAEICGLWELNTSGTELKCTHFEIRGDSGDVSGFVQKSKSMTFARGVGLPGQVWESDGPVWLPNTVSGDRFPRAQIAAAIGIHSAIGFPIHVGAEFYGVIEFFTRRPLLAEQPLLNMLEAIGCEIGQFIQKKRVEAERESLLLREKSLREQAETASKLKDEFLATVSHELRTPLNSILGWGQIMHSGALTEEQQKTALETIYRNAKSQAQLIDDLLDTSRLISGNLVLNLGPTEVIPTIHAAIDVVRPSADAKGITISAELDGKNKFITCDTQRLQQMICNLLTNAVKFTPEGGRIDVRFERGGDDAKITVSDTGRGISPEFLPFVFERFRQQDSSSTRSHEGLGLGLSIVRHLAELHGGYASVHSDGPGTGATFTITLPFTGTSAKSLATDEIPAGNTENTEIRDGELSGIRILVIDDDPDACTMLRFGLGMLGAEVSTSHSASEAFEAISTSRPDVLLTDINMPGEDGYALIKRLRGLKPEQGAGIPAIALTAMARPDDSERALSAGFQLHIPKPVEIGDLSASIAELLGRRHTANGNSASGH